MNTVCVIGSNSFSGSDFIDHLLSRRDYQVIGVSRSPEKGPLFLPYKRNDNTARFSFFQCDLNKDMQALEKILLEFKPAYVVNFAAQSEVAPSWDNPEQWFQTNAVAVAYLAKFLSGQSWLQRYMHISSPEVYGTCEGVVDETAPLNPSTPYAASKAAGDLMLFTLYRQFGFPLVMVRSTNVYGAHQQLFKIIPRTAIYLETGKTIELHGGGRAVKSYIHIRDISHGELAVMEKGRPGQIYHLSPDSGIAVRDLVEMICVKMGKDFDLSIKMVTERPGQDKAYIIDSSKARDTFGWKPRISLDEGLNSVIAWVRENMEVIWRESLDYVHKP